MKWVKSLPLACTALNLSIAFVVSFMGVELAGGIDAWRLWLEHSSSAFRWWRMGLYAALGYCVYRLYPTRRTAIGAVVTLTLLELHSLKPLR